MKETAFIIASIMPEEAIVDMLSEALTEHKVINTDKSKGKLLAACAMMMTKDAINKAPGGLEEVMKEMKKIDRSMELLSPKLG